MADFKAAFKAKLAEKAKKPVSATTKYATL